MFARERGSFKVWLGLYCSWICSDFRVCGIWDQWRRIWFSLSSVFLVLLRGPLIEKLEFARPRTPEWGRDASQYCRVLGPNKFICHYHMISPWTCLGRYLVSEMTMVSSFCGMDEEKYFDLVSPKYSRRICFWNLLNDFHPPSNYLIHLISNY